MAKAKLISRRRAARDVTEQRRTERAHADLEQRVEERTAELRALNETLRQEIAERREAEGELERSKELIRCVLDSLPAQIAVLDATGTVIAVNKAWQRFGEENGGDRNGCVGYNYLEACRRATEAGESTAEEAMAGIQCVLDRALAEFKLDYSLTNGGVERRFALCAAPLDMERGGAVISHVEITERHRAVAAMQASHRLLRDIVDGTTDAIFVKDLQGRYRMMNQAGVVGLGRTTQDVAGRCAHELFDPDIARNVAEQDLQTVLSGQTQTFNIMMRLLGRERDFLATRGVCRDERGDVVGVFGIARDITEINRAREALARERNLLRTLIDALPEAIFVKDTEGHFIINNAAHLRHLGDKSGAEVIGKTEFDFFPVDYAERFYADSQNVLTSGRALLDRVETMPDGQGGKRWLLTNKVPLRDPAGRIIGLVGVSYDITDQKRIEQQLSRFASIVESSDDAIISTNVDGTISSWNKAAERIFGYTAEEMCREKINRLAPPDRLEESARARALVRSGDHMKNYETVRQTKDGRLIDIAMTASPLRGEGGEIIGVSAIVRDITERKRLEREILEISDHEKRRIGQDLHDDLCQYLVGISLLANVLDDNLTQQKRAEAADARQINNLVRQAVSKARAIAKGLVPLDLTGNGLVIALEELILTIKQLFNIECHLVCEEGLAFPEKTAATHLYRIAQEAVHNAAKHSGGQRIFIRLRQSENHIVLEVEDDGAGGEGDAVLSGGGLGLHTMKYRAHVIGATLDFLRTASGGSIVRCTLPR